MAVGRECLLGSKSTPPTTRSRSPMVQRRTKVSIGPTSPTLCYDGKRFSQMECTVSYFDKFVLIDLFSVLRLSAYRSIFVFLC